eukprot:Nk52_evm7s2485 gene=Nk52_evmTU7s2485
MISLIKYVCLCVVALVLLATVAKSVTANECAGAKQHPYFPVEVEEKNAYYKGLENLIPVVAGGENKYFVNYIDCDKKSPIAVFYSLGFTTKHFRRSGSFHLDHKYQSCMQNSTKGYTHDTGCDPHSNRQESNKCYDKGHIVASSHMGFAKDAMRATYTMNNVLPQNAYFNERGAWYATEQIIIDNKANCSIERQNIFAGVVYSENATYLPAHDIHISEYWWRVLVVHVKGSSEPETHAWYMPNTKEAIELSDYKVTPEYIESKVQAMKGYEKFGIKPSDDKPSDGKPSDDKPSDDKPSDDKPSDDKPSGASAVFTSPLLLVLAVALTL